MTAGRTVIGLSQHWGTPPIYVKAVKEVLGTIELDPCSNEFSIVHARVEYRLPDQDGLKASWNYRTIYVNPPYGSDPERRTRIRHWLARCEDAHKQYGSEVLALVPVATNTKHWKVHVFGAATGVTFLYDTRLKFLVNGEVSVRGAPMSCAMVYWGDRFVRFQETFLKFGAALDLRPLHAESHMAMRQLRLG